MEARLSEAFASLVPEIQAVYDFISPETPYGPPDGESFHDGFEISWHCDLENLKIV